MMARRSTGLDDLDQFSYTAARFARGTRFVKIDISRLAGDPQQPDRTAAQRQPADRDRAHLYRS
jgi:hypothetical protein